MRTTAGFNPRDARPIPPDIHINQDHPGRDPDERRAFLSGT
jgi:hypothetical protein